MAITAKQQTGNLIHWIRSWLSHNRTSAAQITPPDYAALALQLAGCQNEQQLMALLPVFQQRIRHLFFDASEADLYLLLPDLPADSQRLLHCPGHPPSASLQRALQQQSQLAERTAGTAEQVHAGPAGADSGTLLLQAVELQPGSPSAWLALHFAGLYPPAERLQHSTFALRRTLSQGLSIFRRQQQAIQQALAEERRAQAAELHDSLAQVLGYVRIRSASLQKQCQNGVYAPLQEYADDVASQTLLAYRQVRELISTSRLRLREDTLDSAIAAAIEEFERHSAIVFELDNRCPQLQLSPEQIVQTSYIVRESLTNIVRHAHASHARIRIRQQHHNVRIRIEDNGRGIHAGEARSDSFGLKIMHERAQRIGARLAIAPRTQGGTCVELTLVG